eukprot:1457044-Lingulodinium_polyedra.AAC.1
MLTHGLKPSNGSMRTASSISISPWKRAGPSRSGLAGRWACQRCTVAVAQAIHSPGAPLKPNDSTRYTATKPVSTAGWSSPRPS